MTLFLQGLPVDYMNGLGRLGKDLFETLHRLIRQACLFVDGRGEEGEAKQNR